MTDLSNLAQLPTDDVPWYKRPYLLKLNFIIFSLVMFCTYLGQS
jgi:hypothetical protein